MKDDIRLNQAKVLWDLGFGREQGIEDFESYLATVPEIPEALRADDERFPLLVLVDGRVGLTAACRLAGIRYERGDDNTFVPYDSYKAKNGVRWMRCQDGRHNRNRSIPDCRQAFAPDEAGLDAIEGIALYIQHPEVVKDHGLDLPNSVNVRMARHAGLLPFSGLLDEASIACLFVYEGELLLVPSRSRSASKDRGSASRRDC